MPRFPSTQWSLVHRASQESCQGSRDEMGKLLKRYWQPMFAHLRYKGQSEQAAEDLIQDFMLEILSGDLLSIADARKGKFRTLLLTALDRFAISKYRYETASKRKPQDLQSLDATAPDGTATPAAPPEAAFERAWALDVLAETLAWMRTECEETGQLDRWTVFELRLLTPLWDDRPPVDYAELANQLQLANDKAAMNLLVTAKRQFARTLRELVRDYVTRAHDLRPAIDDGLAHEPAGAAATQRVDRQLAEHAIQQSIEQEIRDLQQVLASCRVACAVQPSSSWEQKAEDNPLKLFFWQRLTHSAESPAGGELRAMYQWGNDLEEADLDVCWRDLLDSDIRHLLGAEYGRDGTLREFLDQQQPPLTCLEHLKEWASVQRLSHGRSVPGKLASAVYFLVIAIALVRANQTLTDLGEQGLLAGFGWLGDQSWLEEEYRSTIDAAGRCVGNRQTRVQHGLATS